MSYIYITKVNGVSKESQHQLKTAGECVFSMHLMFVGTAHAVVIPIVNCACKLCIPNGTVTIYIGLLHRHVLLSAVCKCMC